MTDDRDFTSYVAARWTPLVRTLVGMGAPPAAAHRTAQEALSRCHDDWDSRDEWVDLDVHVFGELLERWERSGTAWWAQPWTDELDETGWADLEGVLDRMPVPDRRALVLREVAGLGPEQARAVAGTAAAEPEPGVAAALVAALGLLPVEPPPTAAMIGASQRRRSRSRMVALAGGVAVLAVVGAVAAVTLRDDAAPPPPDREAFGPVRSVAYDNPSPVAWYAAGTLYLPHSQVDLRDVRRFAQWDDGAVYLDVRGNLVTVTRDGDRELLATLSPGSSFTVSDSTDRVVWLDAERSELVIHDLETGGRLAQRALETEGATVVSADRFVVYLATGDALEAISLDDARAVQVEERRLPGELDRDGPFVLTREGGGAATARVRLYDTRTGEPVPLALDEPRSVTAAGFGPDGSVMLLIEPPGAQVSQVRRCVRPFDGCRLVALFPAGGARSLLAS